ncbi:MAG: PP2C family serine/threonine-protein phosphatase, partial [Halobacteriovoraceae bacterium]|nr:PP2C family serine/threonine-protein phosphatase [Halobacteriovoraceae bacterium]
MSILRSYAAKTDQGPYLQINEDGHLIDYAHGLFLVLDGFGGSGIGDKTTTLVKENLKKFYLKIGGDPNATLPFFHSPKYLLEGNALINAMYYAHMEVIKHNTEKKISSRGGACGIGVALSKNMLTFSSAGNCMAYLFRQGELNVLAKPDGRFS